MIRDTLDLILLQANRRNLAIEVFKDKGIPPTIYSDEDRLRQVLLNLLTNALKYTSKGGISLKILNNSHSKDSIIFKVQDTGTGISKQKQSQLFKLLSSDNLISGSFSCSDNKSRRNLKFKNKQKSD